jgi:O-antigen ligase
VISAVLVVLVACLAPWAFGAAEPLWWGTAAAACLLVASVPLLRAALSGPRGDEPPRPFGRMSLLLPAVAAVGLLPIPMALRRVVSPNAASVLADADPSAAEGWRPVSLDPHATAGAVSVAAACAAVFWLVLCAGRDERRARVLRTILVAGGVALAAFGLWHRLFHYDQTAIFWGDWKHPLPEVATPFGPYVNRNHFAGAMLLFAGLAAGPALAAASQRRFAAGVWWLAALTAILVALVATTSRGGLVGLVAGALALVAVSRRTSRARVLMGVVAAAVVVAGAMAWLGLLDDLLARFHIVLVGREKNRFAVQWDALTVFAKSPLFGTGAGTFAGVYPPFQTVDDLRFFSNAHGDWAQFLMETGVLGAAFALAAGARLAGLARGAGARTDPRRWLVLGPAAGCVAMCVHGLFETNLHLPSNALLFAATLSLAFAASLAETRPEENAAAGAQGGGAGPSTG